MSSWWKLVGLNAYINPAQVLTIYSSSSGGGNYHIDVDHNSGGSLVSQTLDGTFASQALADAALKRLVQGIDPSTFA